MTYTKKAGLMSIACFLAGISGNIFFMGATLPFGLYYLYKMNQK